MTQFFDYIDAHPSQAALILLCIIVVGWIYFEIKNPWDGDRFPLE
jgi:hypothetical protein